MTEALKHFYLFFSVMLLVFLSNIVKAQDINPYKAEEVKPYNAQEATHDRNDSPAKKNDPAKTSLQNLFGLYQYWVPGTSYTIPDYTNQQVVIHNSSGTGVLPGGIKINADGSYVWNSSWDGKVIKGKWMATGDRSYPLALQNAQEGKTWKVGISTDKGADIVIWDGSTWYDGKKIKK